MVTVAMSIQSLDAHTGAEVEAALLELAKARGWRIASMAVREYVAYRPRTAPDIPRSV